MIINDDITNPDYIGMIQVLWLKREREREKNHTSPDRRMANN